jgi:hypothetical protein
MLREVYIFHFILIAITIQKLLPYFGTSKISIKSLFLIIYSTLFLFYIFIILKNLFPDLYILGLISLYGLFVLFCASKNYLKIPQKRLVVFFTIISLFIIGYYAILVTILFYLFI